MDDDNRRGAQRQRLFEMYEVSHPGESMRTEVCDLSMTGMRIRADREVAPDTVLHVHAHYNPLGFPLHAAVRWCRPSDDGRFEAGLEFLNLTLDERELLKDHLTMLEWTRSDEA